MSGDGEVRAPADWKRLRERLDAVGRALEEGAELSPERAREVLEERAARIARRVGRPASDDQLEVLTVHLAGERFAVESRYVFEIFRLDHLALVPGGAAALAGVTAWRGGLLTVFDLRAMTGAPASGRDLPLVVVLGEREPAFGVLVEAVEGVNPLDASDLHAEPEGWAAAAEHVRGITPDAVVLVDAGGLIRTYT